MISYALYDMAGNKVPQELVTKVGDDFKSIMDEACLLSILSVCTFVFYHIPDAFSHNLSVNTLSLQSGEPSTSRKQ